MGWDMVFEDKMKNVKGKQMSEYRYTVVTSDFIVDGPECHCGNKDWFATGDSLWTCSYCKRTRKAQHIGIIVNGPECHCSNKDWFVGKSIVRCSYCDRSREVETQGYIVNGPECQCGGKDWIIGREIYRCTYCDRSRDRQK